MKLRRSSLSIAKKYVCIVGGWIWVTVMDVMSLKFNSSHYNLLYFSPL